MTENRSFPVGIDLGTTFSAIAYVNADTQRAEVIVTPDQERIVSSVVMFEDENNVIVGDLARKNAVAEPARVVEFVKRQMGKPKDDILDAKGSVVNEGWHFEVDGKRYSAQEISALILKRLKTAAEERMGSAITDAVITCPAYFGDPERAATKEAGRIAGFNVLGVLDEPIAAALSYRLDKVKKDEKVFVFDLGGGTLDVTIMDIAGGNIREIAVGGNHNLGGKDWDDKIIKHVANMFKDQYNVNPLEDSTAYQELQLKATDAKIALSRKDKATIVFSYAGNSLKHEMTRQQFEELTKDLLQECEMLCEKVLNDVEMNWSGIDTLLLVGGSTRMPMIDNMLTRISGKIPSKDLNPDDCVALGAAWQAVLKRPEPVPDELKGKIGGIDVQKVSSHDLGVIALNSAGQERSFLMIPKFTPLPFEKQERFGTASDSQKSVLIRITEKGMYGEDGSCNHLECTQIGEVALDDFPPLPKGSPIEVTYKFNESGILEVKGREPSSGKLVTASIEHTGGLSEREIEDAQKHNDMITVTG